MATAIGTVEKLVGVVTVRHPDGTRTVLEKGAAIHQGDVIETGADGKVGVTFADSSSFSLGPKGSMVMDELVYDPLAHSGALTVSVAKGVYSFVSGQIAKVDPTAMTIKTPVMTIGVRGTSGAGQAGGEGESNSLTLLQDPQGTVGEIILTNAGGSRTINQANFSISLTSYIQPPPPPVYQSPQQIQNNYGSTLSANPQPPQPSLAPPPPPPVHNDAPPPYNGPPDDLNHRIVAPPPPPPPPPPP
ncbi:MAG: FecR domain-containing protein, partial [Rhodospirillaceae bacterium]|nr:FecR domain-containing protein [Rhodospirillales bacterium]